MKRSEIWEIHLDSVKNATGHEVAKSRPALILSVDEFNSSGLGMIVVIPLGSRPPRFETDVLIEKTTENGLEWSGTLFCDQLRSVSVKRLLHRRGTASADVLNAVEEITKTMLFP